MITDSKEYMTMTIHYALFENHLTTDPADYTAVVQPAGSADTKAIADRMVQQGSTVTRADMKIAINPKERRIKAMLTTLQVLPLPLATIVGG